MFNISKLSQSNIAFSGILFKKEEKRKDEKGKHMGSCLYFKVIIAYEFTKASFQNEIRNYKTAEL